MIPNSNEKYKINLLSNSVTFRVLIDGRADGRTDRWTKKW